MPRRFERDGQTRVAYSPADAVKLKAMGWVEQTESEPVTADDLTVDVPDAQSAAQDALDEQQGDEDGTADGS